MPLASFEEKMEELQTSKQDVFPAALSPIKTTPSPSNSNTTDASINSGSILTAFGQEGLSDKSAGIYTSCMCKKR